MEGIIKSIKCDPAAAIVNDSFFEIDTKIWVEADVDAMYRECVAAGFEPADITVMSDLGGTLAELKSAGVKSVSIKIETSLAA